MAIRRNLQRFPVLAVAEAAQAHRQEPEQEQMEDLAAAAARPPQVVLVEPEIPHRRLLLKEQTVVPQAGCCPLFVAPEAVEEDIHPLAAMEMRTRLVEMEEMEHLPQSPEVHMRAVAAVDTEMDLPLRSDLVETEEPEEAVPARDLKVLQFQAPQTLAAAAAAALRSKALQHRITMEPMAVPA
jgi:hypothetical protein